MGNIPTPEEARQFALARRQAKKDELDQKTLEKRSELYGDLIVEGEDLMKDEDVDDVPRLEAALAGLRGGAAPAKTDDVELAKFRKENEELKTSKGRLEKDVTSKDNKITSLESEIVGLKEELEELKEVKAAKPEPPKPTSPPKPAKPAPPTPTKTKTDPAPAEPVKAKKAKKVPASPAPKSKKVKKTDTAPAAPAKKTWRDRAKQLADNAKS